jgi:hypothetical protein
MLSSTQLEYQSCLFGFGAAKNPRPTLEIQSIRNRPQETSKRQLVIRKRQKSVSANVRSGYGGQNTVSVRETFKTVRETFKTVCETPLLRSLFKFRG